VSDSVFCYQLLLNICVGQRNHDRPQFQERILSHRKKEYFLNVTFVNSLSKVISYDQIERFSSA